MVTKIRYCRRSRISEAAFRKLVRCFAMDLTVTVTTEMTGISFRSGNTFYLKICQRLSEACEQASLLNGADDVSKSYFGAHRVRGRRGRGAYGKTIIFGLLKRQGMVNTEIVPDYTKAMLQGIIWGHIVPASVIHSDGWPGYDGQVDIGFDKRFRVNHGANEFASGERLINSIESFWSYTKRRMDKFNGLTKRTLCMHLKKTGFQFNHRGDNL